MRGCLSRVSAVRPLPLPVRLVSLVVHLVVMVALLVQLLVSSSVGVAGQTAEQSARAMLAGEVEVWRIFAGEIGSQPAAKALNGVPVGTQRPAKQSREFTFNIGVNTKKPLTPLQQRQKRVEDAMRKMRATRALQPAVAGPPMVPVFGLAELASQATMARYPTTALVGAAGAGAGYASVYTAAGNRDAAVVRRDIRGGGTDAASPIFPLYTFDADHRVIMASAYVRRTVSANPGTLAEHWCDAAWNPEGGAAVGAAAGNLNFYVQGLSQSRIGSIYQEGHIIASSMDGSDTDPLNFFPHHYQSNGCGSRWWRIEKIAYAVQNAFDHGVTPAMQACTTEIFPEFHYGGGATAGDIGAAWGNAVIPPPPGVVPGSRRDHFVPRGGIYTVQVSNACRALLVANTGAGVAAGPLNNAYLNSFVNHAVWLGGSYHLITPWKNGPDMALAADPATLALPKAAEYSVAANLF